MISQILRQPDYAVFRTSKSSGIGDQLCHYPRLLLLPRDCPPPRLLLAFTIFLLRLESVLFSFAAFLSNCLLPLDLPTIYRRYNLGYMIFIENHGYANTLCPN
jgi:hypothetical protein